MTTGGSQFWFVNPGIYWGGRYNYNKDNRKAPQSFLGTLLVSASFGVIRFGNGTDSAVRVWGIEPRARSLCGRNETGFDSGKFYSFSQ